MSRTTVRQEIADRLLESLSSSNNQIVRKALEKGGRPQVIQLKNLDFIKDTINKLIETDQIPDLKIRITQKRIKKAREFAEAMQMRWLRKQQLTKVTDSIAYKMLATRRPPIAADIAMGESFIVGSFRSLRTLKNKIVNMVLEEETEEIRKIVRSKVQRGHGVEGGDAVSTVQIAEAAGFAASEGIDLSKTKGLDSYLEDQFTTYDIPNIDRQIEIVKNILVEYQAFISAQGKLTADYIPIVTFQDWFSNVGIDSRTERLILQVVREFFETKVTAQELVNMEGSKSIKDKIESHFVEKLTKDLKLAKTTKRVKKTTSSDTKRKKAPSKDNKTKVSSVKKTGPKSAAAFAAPRKPKAKTKGNTVTLPKLIGILNQRLPTVVARNMGDPRLNYRTGRFANSVRAVGATRTSGGFPSIAYTYQRNPYETFEQGRLQGSPDRDPRKLIDMSIREIAAQFALGRLYTRRV